MATKLRAATEPSPTLPSGAAWVRFFYVLLVLLLGVLALALFARLQFFTSEVNKWLPYPFFRSGSEGLMLSEINMVRQGQSIYVPLQPDRFISAPYPPFYYYLVAWFWPHTSSNIAANSAALGFETGRIISLVAALLTALSVGLLAVLDSSRQLLVSSTNAKWFTRLWPLLLTGLVGAALFLSFPAVTVWAARVRADTLMTALQIIGLVLVAWKPRGWQIWLAIPFFALAIYTKQTALAGPCAAFIFLLLHNWPNWKRLVAWVAAFVGANLLPLVIINVATKGEFWLRLAKYHNLGWLFSNFSLYFNLFLGENAALLVAGLILLVWIVLIFVRQFHSNKKDWLDAGRQIPLSLLYLIFSLPVLLGLGVAGADHNHFLPAEAATAAVGATLLGWTLTRFAQMPQRWTVLGAVVLLIAQAAIFAVPSQHYEIEFRMYKPDEQTQLDKIVQMAAGNPLPLLTSEAGFFPLTGKSPNYDDLFTLEALAQKGEYDQSGLLDAIKQKKFGLILAEGDLFSGTARSDVWTPELLAAIKANYKPLYHDVWFSYVPKS